MTGKKYKKLTIWQEKNIKKTYNLTGKKKTYNLTGKKKLTIWQEKI